MNPALIASAVGTAKDIKQGIIDPAKRVLSATAKTSLTRLTSDQIFQFPLYMNADIDDDEKYPIVKSIEKNYAAIVMTALSNEGMIDRDKYAHINQFLTQYHSNTGKTYSTAGSLESDSNIDDELQIVDAVAMEGYCTNNEIVKMNTPFGAQFDTESINNMYLPFKRTAAKLERAIESAHASIAMEASKGTKYFRIPAYKKDKNGNIVYDKTMGGSPIMQTDKNGQVMYQYVEADPSNPNYNKWVDKFGEPLTTQDLGDIDIQNKIISATKLAEAEAKRTENISKMNALSRAGGKMDRDSGKMSALMPTVLNITLANTKSGVGTWTQNLIIGIRATPRYIPQSVMLANMIEAFKDAVYSGLLFNFVKLTSGEMKWHDFLLGISSSKNQGLINKDNRWIKVLKKSAVKNKKARKVLRNSNPNTTVIITESDAHLIHEQCGVDPNNPASVIKMMDKYFLLGFGIYDTEAKMLKIIYDGESDFTEVSLRSMMAESKKETNLLAMNKY